jgi:hypothetical protein
MSEEKNDKWLEKIISKTINSGKPQFDAEKFKQKFPDEFQVLQSRANKPTIKPQGTFIFKNPVIKFATAAAIILALSLFMIRSGKDEKVKIPKITNVTQSPAEMLTLRSLKTAYYKGGIEAVEAQCDNAIEQLKQKTKKITTNELLADINGT